VLSLLSNDNNSHKPGAVACPAKGTLPPLFTNTMTSGGIFTQLHKLLWSTLTFVGNRRLIGVIRSLFFRDTIFYFEPTEKLVALTIDDGLSRGGSSTSMVKEVLELLARYNAHATFFVCSNYCSGDDEMKQATGDLVHVHGHELGNHMSEDVAGYYSKLGKEEFQVEFESANSVLEDLVNGESDETDRKPQKYFVRWYRALQGVYTPAMQQVLKERNIKISFQDKNSSRMMAEHVLDDCERDAETSTRDNISSGKIMQHVLGDCYSDDWALACRDSSFVYRTTMRQVREGSILITHMPEKNTDREAIFDVLEMLLRDLDSQGYRCVSLGEMWEACGNRHAHSEP